MNRSEEVERYIAAFPPEIAQRLSLVRETIRAAAPDATETISYRMPAYRLHGMLVYFAGFANHIGFYPTSSGIEAFREQISEFRFSKGAVQFPHNKAIPLELIGNITQFRVEEDQIGLKHRKRSTTKN